MKKNGFSVQMIAEAGIMIALAKVLSMIKLFEMPLGGSVTLGSMVPIFIFAIRWGWQKGIIVGLVYGIVDFMIGGWYVNPIQVCFDYVFAYAMLGFAGISLSKNKDRESFLSHLPAIALAVFLRGVSHTISGVVFYASSAEGSGMSPFLYSVSYNYSFLAVDFIIAIAILALIWKPIIKIAKPEQ